MSTVFDEEGVHARLYANIEQFAQVAGVPPDMIVHPLTDFCSEPVVDWVRTIKTTSDDGLALVNQPKVEDQCAAIVGSLVRNFLDARFRTVGELLKYTGRDQNPDLHCTALAIPDFGDAVAALKAAELSSVFSLLLARFGEGKKTIVAISDMAALPPRFVAHIEGHFRVVKKSVRR